MMTEDRVKIGCTACGGRLGVPASALGKFLKCPRCNETFFALELQRSASGAAGTAGDEPERPDSNWALGLSSSQMVHLDIRQAFRKRKAGAEEQADAATDKEQVQGAIYAGVGALVGALIWGGVSGLSGREMGWLAWLMGGLAGGGMLYGARRRAVQSGGFAAAITVAGYLIAKVLVTEWVILAQTRIDLQGNALPDGVWSRAFTQSFSWLDILYFLMATVTAYIVAAGTGKE